MNQGDSTPIDLRQSLTQLHSTLSASPALDEESRRLLREVLTDIERALARSPAPAASAARPVPRSRLESLAARFDAGHPTLSASLRELVELLGQAGL